jgi:hypothetical protein
MMFSAPHTTFSFSFNSPYFRIMDTLEREFQEATAEQNLLGVSLAAANVDSEFRVELDSPLYFHNTFSFSYNWLPDLQADKYTRYIQLPPHVWQCQP